MLHDQQRRCRVRREVLRRRQPEAEEAEKIVR